MRTLEQNGLRFREANFQTVCNGGGVCISGLLWTCGPEQSGAPSSNSTAFGKAPRREADSQPISQSGSRSGKQASRQAGRNTQFGFVSGVVYIYKQWGAPIPPKHSAVEW